MYARRFSTKEYIEQKNKRELIGRSFIYKVTTKLYAVATM